MVLSPISNQKYRDHIVGLVREYQGSTKDLFPAVPPLSPDFTRLLPDENVTSIIAKASDWIDLGSDDPVISRVSRQVLNVEVAYAAFCGVSTVILPPLFRGDSTSPKSAAVSRYADAVTRIIAVGPYLQLLMPLPMDNQKQTSIANSTLVALAKGQSSDTASDSLSPWDAWHNVRSACRYSAKLAIGKSNMLPIILSAELLIFVSTHDTTSIAVTHCAISMVCRAAEAPVYADFIFCSKSRRSSRAIEGASIPFVPLHQTPTTSLDCDL